MQTITERLRAARDTFDTALNHADGAFATGHPFRDMARAEALEGFRDNIGAVFDADFNPIVHSAGPVQERLKRCGEAFAVQKTTYEHVFGDSANREICLQQSVKGLKKAFKTILSA